MLRPVAPRPKIWAIGGGKGGVGKTLVTSSLGIFLASCGKRVLIVDADFGAANMHTIFGINGSKTSLSNFLKGEVLDFSNLIVESGVMNLDLACGQKDSLDVADINEKGISMLRTALFRAPYDYVLLDIGPGTGASHLDLFLTAETGLLVTSSEPTSVENSYRFLKCLFLRKMRNAVNDSDHSVLKDALHRLFTNNWSQRVKTISDILQQLKLMDPQNGTLLDELMGGMKIGIIVNSASGAVDTGFGPSMERACADYFGVGIAHIGDIARDERVSESVRLKKPLVLHAPESEAAMALKKCFSKLVSSEERVSDRTSKGMVI
ncbi:MAG: P-loop NTPase [Deltaproteobacteria bacterium]|nr:P-loop NTPase [Deltaproteobacteria bacterium]